MLPLRQIHGMATEDDEFNNDDNSSDDNNDHDNNEHDHSSSDNSDDEHSDGLGDAFVPYLSEGIFFVLVTPYTYYLILFVSTLLLQMRILAIG